MKATSLKLVLKNPINKRTIETKINREGCAIMGNGQAIYDTKHIAKLFEIHNSTVRKYCDFLEKAGHVFHKNE